MSARTKAKLSITAILVFLLTTWMYTLTHTRLIIANGSNQQLDEVTVSYNGETVWSGPMLLRDIRVSSFTAEAFNGFQVRVRTSGKTRCTLLGYHFPYNGDFVVITINPAGDVLYSAKQASSVIHLIGQVVHAVMGLSGEGTSFLVPEPASGCEEPVTQ